MRKILKRSLSILLCAVMMFGVAPLSGFKNIHLQKGMLSGVFGTISGWIDELNLSLSASAVENYESEDGLGYTLDSSGKATIIYYIGSATELVLDKVDGHDIINIGCGAFCGSNLTSVTITGNIKNIGEEAFDSCEYLSNVTMEYGVENIGNSAFNYCISLSNLIFPDSLITIGSAAFDECFCLGYINIPDSVTSIGNAAFALSGLGGITIGNGVTNLGDGLFSGCEYLQEVTIGSGVIGSYMFGGCEWLQSITIGSGVTEICDYAFQGSINLSDVKIENGVKTIGNYLFLSEGVYQRYDYPDITIPDSVTYIAPNAFHGVKNVVFSEIWYHDVMRRKGAPWGANFANTYVSEEENYNLYYYDSSKELLLGCSIEARGAVDIPNTVEEVGENCFYGCEDITTLRFSSPVYFADSAIIGCESLENIDALYNTDNLGIVYTKPVGHTISTASVSGDDISVEYDTGILFCNRSANGNYTVPDEITYICSNAFADCINVTVEIPDSVNLKNIGADAFWNSKDFNGTSKWSDNVLIIGDSIKSSGYIVASKAALSGIYTVPSFIKGIADSSFAGCRLLTGFNVGTSNVLSFLGSNVFRGCSANLKKNISILSTQNLLYVGENSFDIRHDTDSGYMGNILDSVSSDVEGFTIDDGTTIIAEGAFAGCSKLKNIIIPSTVKKIDKNTFKGCINLESVTFECNIDEIGDNAFADCMSLTEITIPASVNKIGHLAFYGCTKISSFNVASENKEYISDNGILMTKDKKTIIQYPAAKVGKTYTIADGVFVSDLAFYRCRNLRKIVIGKNIEYGNRNPFAACSVGFNFEGMETNILFGDLDCTILKSVSASVMGTFIVPDTVTEIGSDAFRECSGITEIDFSDAVDIDIIGDYAFYYCTGLTSITIPNSVTKIGKSAFENCVNLKEVRFDVNDEDYNYTIEKIEEKAFYNCLCSVENNNWYKDYFDVDSMPNIENNAFGNSFVFESEKSFAYGLPLRAMGTDSKITVTDSNGQKVVYSVVIFGDVNGDGWYDGMDALLVNCLANGMLSKDDVGEAVYTAADCNHDGVIDQLDVDILQKAGVLLADVDQSKSEKELLETSSAYVEYLNLIDQTVGTEDIQADDSNDDNVGTDKPVVSVNLFEIVIDFVMKIFSLIKSIFTFTNGILINK